MPRRGNPRRFRWRILRQRPREVFRRFRMRLKNEGRRPLPSRIAHLARTRKRDREMTHGVHQSGNYRRARHQVQRLVGLPLRFERRRGHFAKREYRVRPRVRGRKMAVERLRKQGRDVILDQDMSRRVEETNDVLRLKKEGRIPKVLRRMTVTLRRRHSGRKAEPMDRYERLAHERRNAVFGRSGGILPRDDNVAREAFQEDRRNDQNRGFHTRGHPRFA